eukprot:TRINITY_DN9717_c2_g2_i1.p2 TRINITY_DN9717_c2_g2~~TRINITY_DN9717_c2_g2_i1.p2  ORF type:complete len:369 (+),score=63.58 TRINITY_DN9717_c2_g2_i1:122-1108(+)
MALPPPTAHPCQPVLSPQPRTTSPTRRVTPSPPRTTVLPCATQPLAFGAPPLDSLMRSRLDALRRPQLDSLQLGARSPQQRASAPPARGAAGTSAAFRRSPSPPPRNRKPSASVWAPVPAPAPVQAPQSPRMSPTSDRFGGASWRADAPCAAPQYAGAAGDSAARAPYGTPPPAAPPPPPALAAPPAAAPAHHAGCAAAPAAVAFAAPPPTGFSGAPTPSQLLRLGTCVLLVRDEPLGVPLPPPPSQHRPLSPCRPRAPSSPPAAAATNLPYGYGPPHSPAKPGGGQPIPHRWHAGLRSPPPQAHRSIGRGGSMELSTEASLSPSEPE